VQPLAERPTVAPYVPAGHAVATADAAAQKLPCGHVVQPVAMSVLVLPEVHQPVV
jgi:hypothetical protein